MTVLLAAGILSGCGEMTPVDDVEVIHVLDEHSIGVDWGCSGNYKTTLKNKENRVSTKCGYYGKVGDKISGWWVEGHWEGGRNGFRSHD
ncbi:MAG: hypothetical protein KUG81_11105 [Gammaproteobacteria bacterium]|nr:hypothetical protein [Gammaproteobacteria bacterium]